MSYNQEPVLVFTMGKVGTESLKQCLQEAGVKVYKAHNLRRDVLEERIERARARGKEPKTDLKALDFVKNVHPELKSVKTITVVRESIGRNISGFFQTLWRHGIHPPYEGVNAKDLIELFLEKFNHERPDKWFMYDFASTIGAKPFRMGFDAEAGYHRFNSGKYDVLLLKIELGNQRIGELISEFIDMRIKIEHRHKATNKEYSQLYKDFKKNIVFDRGFLEKMMQGRVMQNYYTEEQRNTVVQYYMREIQEMPVFAPGQ